MEINIFQVTIFTHSRCLSHTTRVTVFPIAALVNCHKFSGLTPSFYSSEGQKSKIKVSAELYSLQRTQGEETHLLAFFSVEKISIPWTVDTYSVFKASIIAFPKLFLLPSSTTFVCSDPPATLLWRHLSLHWSYLDNLGPSPHFNDWNLIIPAKLLTTGSKN